MELPIEVREKIEELAYGHKITELRKISSTLTDRYMNDSGKGNSLLNKDIEALVYSIVRMPATYSSVYAVLKNTFDIYKEEIKTVLDVGAGVGTASLAVSQFIKDAEYTCIEREKSMISLGKQLISRLKSTWIDEDFTKKIFDSKYDLVIASYSLNELNYEDRNRILNNLWSITSKLLVIVEPGTPIGAKEIKEIIESAPSIEGYVVAPCPNIDKCPLSKEEWCHFHSRVARSKLHKLVKNVDVPFEDEKYSYVSISRTPVEKNFTYRLHSDVHVQSNSIYFYGCCSEGLKMKTFYKHDPNYKKYKKANRGDAI